MSKQPPDRVVDNIACPTHERCRAPIACLRELECINSLDQAGMPLRQRDGSLWPGVQSVETPTAVIAELVPRRQQGIPQLLEVVDDLRAKIASGQIVAFAAVGIEADDVTMSWQGCTQGVTNLRLVGAVARLMHGVHTDIDS